MLVFTDFKIQLGFFLEEKYKDVDDVKISRLTGFM